MYTRALRQSTVLEPISLASLPARPLVSILIANYNYETYIGHTIESALNQTYSHIEVIVCDDGSSDGSVQVLQAYSRKDARLSFFRKANGGHGSALNEAYLRSRGEIICLLDSDDLFLPDKVHRVVECCRKQPASGFVVHRVIRISQSGRRQGVWPMSDALPAGWLGPTLVEHGGVLANLPPTSGISVRRQVADALFPLPISRPLGACPDQVVMRLAPLLTEVGAIAQPLAEYRLHAHNSYGTSRITVAFLEREIAVCRSLWQAQHNFLSEQHPASAGGLTAVETSSYLLYLRYLLARLSRDPEVRLRHAEYLADLRRQPDARYVRFWQTSLHLPLFLFDYAINLMSRQSALKQVMAKLKGLV